MMSWNIGVLLWICGVCCGILFMLLPTVTLFVNRVLKLNGQSNSRPLNASALQPSANQVLEARRLLKDKGYIIRERRSL
jgi:hypothetical protein